MAGIYSKNMEPLSKDVTDEIRFILEGCRDGVLNHDQRNYHCGTSHCIAGWKQLLDFAAEKDEPELVATNYDDDIDCKVELDKFTKEKTGYRHTGNYAQEAWGLTVQEASQLFNVGAKFPQQFELLERLERGERVE